MTKINLLPKEISKKTEIKQKGRLIGVVGIFILALLFGSYGLRMLRYKRISKKIDEVNQQLKQLKSIVAQVDRLEQDRKSLNRKLSVIQNLVKKRFLYPCLLEDLAKFVPSSCWLKSLSTTLQGDGIKLNMSVVANDNYALADFLSLLEKLPNFSNIGFTGFSTQSIQEKEIRTFNITCDYQPLMLRKGG